MRSSLLVIGLSCLIALPCFANKQSVYSWVDDKGVTHYGQRPPQSADATLIKKGRFEDEASKPRIEGVAADNTTAPAPRTDLNKEKLQAEEIARLDLERCDAAIKNLEALTSQRTVRTMNEDGSSRILETHEREEKIREMNQAMEESCKNQL